MCVLTGSSWPSVRVSSAACWANQYDLTPEATVRDSTFTTALIDQSAPSGSPLTMCSQGPLVVVRVPGVHEQALRSVLEYIYACECPAEALTVGDEVWRVVRWAGLSKDLGSCAC